MRDTGEYLFTSESVSEGHPDKVADRISDTVLDAFLGADPSRSPYRARFAVWVDGDRGRAPELVNLLD